MTEPAPAGPAPDDPAAWIGRTHSRRDIITERLVAGFTATLAPLSGTGGATPDGVPPGSVPPGLFWCLAPDIVAAEDLGPDGHPRLGLFLPRLPYPRRMWAGGELRFHGAFATGDSVTRTSTIENIAFKTGSSGRLAFVTVRHHYGVGDRLVLDERQDIVYREPAPPGTATGGAPQAGATPIDVPAETPPLAVRDIATDPVMLFRYSALTFNGHRIHYDQPYATGVEGYAGLVVHGPLQATLLLDLVTHWLGTLPGRFSYRGVAPLICGTPCRADLRASDEGGLSARIVTSGGQVTMTASAGA